MVFYFKGLMSVFTSFIFLLFIILSLSLTYAHDAQGIEYPESYFRQKAYSQDAINFISKHFGWDTMIEVSIDSKKPDSIKDPKFLKAVESLQRYLERDSSLQIIHTSSLADIIKTMNKVLNQGNAYYKVPDKRKELAEDLFLYVQSVPFGRDINNQISVDQSALRMTVRLAKSSSKHISKVIRAIRVYSKKHLSKYEVDIATHDQLTYYNPLRKRFTIDKTLLVAFRDDKGIFNNETLPVIQRLTRKFWKTKYVTRVDSLTNYSHTYVSRDILEVKGLIETRKPSQAKLKKLLSPYVKKGRSIQLITDLLGSVLPYSQERLKGLIGQTSISKEAMADLIAETLYAKLPLDKPKLKSFIHQYISQDQRIVQKLMSEFFPTVKDIKVFLLKHVTNDSTKAEQLANKVIYSKGRLKALIFPHYVDDGYSDIVIYRLRDKLDKLPPNKNDLVRWILPHVSQRNPNDLFVETLQEAFPPYYTKKKLKEWLTSPDLSKESRTELLLEALIAMLPLTEKEFKGFIERHVGRGQKVTKLLSNLKLKLFHTDKELKEKKSIAMNEKLVRGLYVTPDGKYTLLQISLEVPDYNKRKIDDALERIKKVLAKEQIQSGYRFYVTSPN